MKNNWQEFKDCFYNIFNAEPIVADYIAVLDILRLCASGKCNLVISKYLDEELVYVNEVIKEFLNFRGYEKDLDVNTLSVYNRAKGKESDYRAEIGLISNLLSHDDFNLSLSFNICEKYTNIERKVDNFYANS